MKYRTKLYISLVSVALSSIVLGLIIFSTQAEQFVLGIIKSRLLSIVATGANTIDPNLFRPNPNLTMDSPEYIKAREVLLNIQNANRRSDIYLAVVYTLYPDPKNPNTLLIGIDSDIDPSPPGSKYIYSDQSLILKNIKAYFVDPAFIGDILGVWLSAFAPIIDEQGNYVATLAVDINATDIQKRLEQLIKFALYGLSASLLFALILAFFLSKKVTTSLDNVCNVVKEIEHGNLQAEAKIYTNDEFGELGKRINSMTKGLQERERLKTSFARYVSKHVLDKILQSETPLKLEGERRKITLLFSDLRQFTLLAEALPPEDVVKILNEYFEQMIEVIFSHFGTLDKFIGDGIMAEFGAPLDDKEQEYHAISAALQMQEELQKLCDKWIKENKPAIKMGIGIHTGEAILGNIGSEKRTEYTAIGDSVNVASRLEQATKILKTPILLSETTYLGCKDRFPFKDLGSMALPGRREQIRVYTLDWDALYSGKFTETKST